MENVFWLVVLACAVIAFYTRKERKHRSQVLAAAAKKIVSPTEVTVDRIPEGLPEINLTKSKAVTPTEKRLRDIENQRKHWGAAIPSTPIRSDTRMVYIDRLDEDDLFEPPAFTADFLATQFPDDPKSPLPRIGRYYREPAAYTKFGSDYVQLQ